MIIRSGSCKTTQDGYRPVIYYLEHLLQDQDESQMLGSTRGLFDEPVRHIIAFSQIHITTFLLIPSEEILCQSLKSALSNPLKPEGLKTDEVQCSGGVSCMLDKVDCDTYMWSLLEKNKAFFLGVATIRVIVLGSVLGLPICRNSPCISTVASYRLGRAGFPQ